MGKNGLVSTRLFSGIIPCSPIINTELPTQVVRMKAIKIVQAEMNAIVSELQARNVLIHEAPVALDLKFEVEEKVLAYSDNKKEWVGPLIVMRHEGRMVSVQSLDELRTRTINTFQINRFLRNFLFELKKTIRTSEFPLQNNSSIRPKSI